MVRFKWSILGGVIFVVCAAVPPLLDRLEKTSIGTGFDSGFSYKSRGHATGSEIIFNVESSDTCYIRFKLAGITPAGAACTAHTLDGPLTCTSCPDDPGTFEISAAPVKPPVHAKFQWNSGNPVYVDVPVPGLPDSAVIEWTVIPDKHSPDSSLFVARRRLFELIFWSVAFISLVGAVVAFVVEKKATSQTPQQLAAANIESFFDSVEGRSPAETKMMRAYLHKKIAGIPHVQAREASGIPPGSKGSGIVFAAKSQMNSQIETLIAVQLDIAKKI